MSVLDKRAYQSSRMIFKLPIYTPVENPSEDANPREEKWYYKVSDLIYRRSRDSTVNPQTTYYIRSDGPVKDHKTLYFNNKETGRFTTMNHAHYSIFVPEDNILYELDPDRDPDDYRPRLAWQKGFDDDYIIVPAFEQFNARSIIVYPEIEDQKVWRMFGFCEEMNKVGTTYKNKLYKSSHTPAALGEYFKVGDHIFADFDPGAAFKSRDKDYKEVEEEDVTPDKNPHQLEWTEKKKVSVQEVKPEDNPKEKKWFEKNDQNWYIPTEDTSPVEEKIYYEEKGDDYIVVPEPRPIDGKSYYYWTGGYKDKYPSDFIKIKSVSEDGRMLYTQKQMSDSARVRSSQCAYSGADSLCYGRKNYICKDGFIYDSAVRSAHTRTAPDGQEITNYTRSVSYQKIKEDGTFEEEPISLFDVYDDGVDCAIPWHSWESFDEGCYSDYCAEGPNSTKVYALNARAGDYYIPDHGWVVGYRFGALYIDEYDITTGEKTNSWSYIFRRIAGEGCSGCNLVYANDGVYLFAHFRQDSLLQGGFIFKCSGGFEPVGRIPDIVYSGSAGYPTLPYTMYINTLGSQWRWIVRPSTYANSHWIDSRLYPGSWTDADAGESIFVSSDHGALWTRIKNYERDERYPYSHIYIDNRYKVTAVDYKGENPAEVVIPPMPVSSMYYENRKLSNNPKWFAYRNVLATDGYHTGPFIFLKNKNGIPSEGAFYIDSPDLNLYVHGDLEWCSEKEIMDYYVNKEGE